MMSNTSRQEAADSPNEIINPTVFKLFLTFNFVICAELIGCFGIVGNILNIVHFTKQGLQDSINITLTTLAVSDIGYLLFQIPFYIFFGYPFGDFSTSHSQAPPPCSFSTHTTTLSVSAVSYVSYLGLKYIPEANSKVETISDRCEHVTVKRQGGNRFGQGEKDFGHVDHGVRHLCGLSDRRMCLVYSCGVYAEATAGGALL
ncbi:hypothetical protein Btru_045943 [Bulinus truncatus]|nr:hypothetical protein Btru_045943 [Bulinus truncatus]